MKNLLKKIDWEAIVVLFGCIIAAGFDNLLAAFMWLLGLLIGASWCLYQAKKAKKENNEND